MDSSPLFTFKPDPTIPEKEFDTTTKWYNNKPDSLYVSDEYKKLKADFGFDDSEKSNELYTSIKSTIDSIKVEHTKQLTFYKDVVDLKFELEHKAHEKQHKKMVEVDGTRNYVVN